MVERERLAGAVSDVTFLRIRDYLRSTEPKLVAYSSGSGIRPGELREGDAIAGWPRATEQKFAIETVQPRPPPPNTTHRTSSLRPFIPH